MADAEVQQNVRVMVRVRPFNSRELNLESIDTIRSVIEMNGNTVTVLDADHSYQERDAFEFDECFWSIPESQNQLTSKTFATQEDVFEKCGKPAVENALRGYHNTIFAYGQTGSGKTHSMLGNDTNEGIAPRLVRRLFARIAEERTINPHERMQYTVELSFLEIYNEKVKDLLLKAQSKKANKSDEYSECRVRQHPEKGTFVEGLMRLHIESEEQCLTAIKEGMEHRAVTSTLMNDTSSRSHAIFQICLTQKSPLKGTSRVSIINLVDLAGSERIKMSGVSGQALQEAKNINLSLSTLRRVIDVLIDNSKLKKGQRGAVPPYRESLLTWVLSDSLGGNSQTVMVAAVSPYAGNIEDTIGTLRYALKAKAIVCHARVNEEKTAAVVHQLRGEMEALRKQLEDKALADVAEQERLVLALREREDEWRRMREDSERLDSLKTQYEAELVSKAEELTRAQEQMAALDDVEGERQRKEQELAEARARQEATARQLQQQQEERRKRDAELQAVLARKASLEATHDRTAVEEARAKLEVEQARMRQFANAFQNAFVLGKQRSGLDELRSENQALKEKLTTLEVQASTSEKDLAVLAAEKQTMERKVELLDRKCQAMLRDLQAVMRGKNERIEELSTRKDAVAGDLDKLLRELERRREELAKVKQLHADETLQLKERADELRHQREHCRKDIAIKESNIGALQKLIEQTKGETERLDANAAAYEAKAAELREGVETRAKLVEDLKRQRELHVRQRDEARHQLEERKRELADAHNELALVKADVETLQHNHRELREFVTAHFFPSANRRAVSAASPSSPPRATNGHGAAAASSNHGSAYYTTPPARGAPNGPTTPLSSARRTGQYSNTAAGATPRTSAAAVGSGAVNVRNYTRGGVRYETNTPQGFAQSPLPTRPLGSSTGGSTPRRR
jgi:hypothetical protein